MKALRSLFRPAVAALAAAYLFAPSWAALADPSVGERQARETMVVESDDCYSIGERVAAQNGGMLARATATSQSGQQVCVVVVLISAKDGQRPRRSEIVVALN